MRSTNFGCGMSTDDRVSTVVSDLGYSGYVASDAPCIELSFFVYLPRLYFGAIAMFYTVVEMWFVIVVVAAVDNSCCVTVG